MTVLRRVARPLLASMFISGGYNAVRDPARLVPASEVVTGPVAETIASRTSLLPDDPEHLVRLNGAVQLGAGILLALGRSPRLASAALAATLVPTTLAAHRYWTIEDPKERAAQRTHFFKNASLLGGLLIAVADTHGKPSLAYRTRNVVGHASGAVTHQAHAAADRVGDVAGSAVDGLAGAVEAARKHLP